MKRTACVILMLIVLAGGLTGCHGVNEKSPFVVPETFDESKTYEISFWAKNDTNKTQTEIYEKAISDFEKTLLPDAASFGRTIYVNANYVGDVWAYCIGGDEPNAMLSFCVFEKSLWGKGIASEAVRIFLDEMKEKYSLRSMGAFTFSNNQASINVLMKNGFQEKETFTENGVESKYFQIDFLMAESKGLEMAKWR